MKRQSRTEFAVLGMLAHEAMSGYDLKRQFEERIAHFWSESVGQIYPTLKQLVASGLAKAKESPRKSGPRRVEYSITRKGRDQLRNWLHEPVARESVRNEMMLKTFFGSHGDVQVTLEHVRAFEAQQKAIRAQFRLYEDSVVDEASNDVERDFWQLTLRSGQLINEARLKWCREAKRVLQQHVDSE